MDCFDLYDFITPENITKNTSNLTPEYSGKHQQVQDSQDMKNLNELSENVQDMEEVVNTNNQPSEKKVEKKRKPRTKAKSNVSKEENKPSDTSKTKVSTVVLRDISGKPVPLDVVQIGRMTASISTDMDRLADQILTKVTASDNEFNEGIQQILTLTQTVDTKSLSPNAKKGFLQKLRSRWVDSKVRVMSQFNTVSDQVVQIAKSLDANVARMESETTWLRNTAISHANYIRKLEAMNENIREVLECEKERLRDMRDVAKNGEYNMMDIETQKLIVSTLEKQADKTMRLHAFALSTAPQIAAMQKVNVDSIDKFQTLKGDVLPAWKSNLSYALMSQQQNKDLAMSNAIQDTFNEFVKASAEMSANNLIMAAEASQRSVIDTETIIYVQDTMIDAVKQSIQTENNSAQIREQAFKQIQNANEKLKTSLLEIEEMKNNDSI